jgi:prepilin-type N-terminal cleavage/methylation domain-containing protein
MHPYDSGNRSEAGFSLIELMIAMTVTLVVMGLASSMIAQSFNIRSRENQRTEALGDAQRALISITRDVANAGLGLLNNGLVTGDSTATSIRIRSNLNGFTETTQATDDANEDIKYRLINDANGQFIIRQDFTSASTTVLANRVSGLTVRYFREKVDYTTDPATCAVTSPTPTNVTVGGASVANDVAANPDLAKYVVIGVCVSLPAIGSSGVSGYQPASQIMLVSDAVLRNSSTSLY